MKTILTLLLFSSFVFANPLPKDPRINVAKDVAVKLFRGHVPHVAAVKVNVLEQKHSFFLTQVVAKNKKNYCFIFAVDMVDNNPEITILANHVDDKDKETKDAFLQECSTNPTPDELTSFKTLNNWPTVE